MKRTLLVGCLALVTTFLSAQKIYFVYLQTETGEPFFIRMNDKLYSSTASGYLILSKLKDSTYPIKLGFPGKSIDLEFKIAINRKDHGYLIKNMGEKGWGLFDMQSLSLDMAAPNAKNGAQIINGSGPPVNAFTDMLSRAVDDPSLKVTPVAVKEEEKKPQVTEAVVKEDKRPSATDAVVKEEKKPGTVPLPVNDTEMKKPVAKDALAENKKPGTATQPVIKPDEKKSGTTEPLVIQQKKPVVKDTVEKDQKNSEVAIIEEQKVLPEKKDSVVLKEVYKPSMVKKISGVESADGFESVFVDQLQDGTGDTIRIFIPGNAEKTAAIEEKKTEDKVEEPKFLDFNADTSRSVSKSQPEIIREQKSGTIQKQVSQESKTGCKSVAETDDFLKLRRKMAGKTNDDGMIAEARKYFKSKCFTTEQVKNLSSMFLSNAGKFNFFYAAHDHVSDAEHFSSLQSELKDEYYINRFKTLTGN